MNPGPNQEKPDEPKAEWNAYTDYQHVTRRVAESVGDAIDAISTIEAAKLSGEKLSSRQETDLRTDVMAAVTRLRNELENERDTKDVYDEILSRWEGEEGSLKKFQQMNIMTPTPEPWLQQFAADIHRAGWELGYLKAGREEKVTEGGDDGDGQIREMLDEEDGL